MQLPAGFPNDGGSASSFPIRPVITVPGVGGDALSVGLPLVELEKVLAPIRQSTPVQVRFEALHAPQMLMVSMPQGAVDQAAPHVNFVNELLTTLAQDQAPPGGFVSPVETDLAFCQRAELPNGTVAATSTSELYQPVQIPLLRDGGTANGVIELHRFGGTLSDLTFLPDDVDGGVPTLTTPAGDTASFDVSIRLQNLSAYLEGHDTAVFLANGPIGIEIDELSVSCKGTFVAAPPSAMAPDKWFCGDRLFQCLPGTENVVVDGFRTSVALPDLMWFFEQEDFVDFVKWWLVNVGPQFHFSNYAVTSVHADRNLGVLRLAGQKTVDSDGGSVCSPNNPLMPAMPPTRGLLSSRTQRGHGEVFTNDGWVRPFFIEAEVSTDYHSATQTLPLASGRRLPVALEGDLDVLGREFPPIELFDVSTARTRLTANTRDQECWRRETRGYDVITFPFQTVTAWRSEVLAGMQLEAMKERRVQIVEVAPAAPEEVYAAVRQLGEDCGACEGWSRIRTNVMGDGDRPFGPPDTFPGGPLFEGMPWSMDVFVHANADAVDPWLNPFLKCEDGHREVAGQRIFSMPSVMFWEAMFDSARVSTEDFKPYPRAREHDAWSMEQPLSISGKARRVVYLFEDCLSAPGACWEGVMEAPQVGKVWVDAAASSTVTPRIPLATAMTTGQAGPIASYGARTSAVHGYFDRSRVELYSAVPQAYVDASISAAGFDYRGGAVLDWRHGPAFVEPDVNRNDTQFPHSGFEDWLNPRASSSDARKVPFVRYRADWATDTLRLRRRPGTELTYCALPEQLSVEADTIGFVGAGLEEEKLVPANLVFPQATVPVSISDAAWRWGTTTAALIP